MRWGACVALLVLSTIAAMFSACVGDSTASGDAGGDATTDATSDALNDVASEAQSDAPVEAGPACNLGKPFGAPVAVTELNTAANDVAARLTHDELTVYFGRTASADAGVDGSVSGFPALFTATRALPTAAFGTVSPLTSLNTNANQYNPSPTGDDKTLYYESDKAGLSSGGFDVVAASRSLTSGPFQNPVDLLGINSSTSNEGDPYVLPPDLVLYFSSDRAGSWDLYRAARTSSSQAYSIDSSGSLTLANTSSTEFLPTVTLDELTLYFASNRTDGGALGGFDIWRSTRISTSAQFSQPTNVAELNTSGNDLPSWISDDGCRLYLQRDTTGGSADIYVATKPLN